MESWGDMEASFKDESYLVFTLVEKATGHLLGSDLCNQYSTKGKCPFGTQHSRARSFVTGWSPGSLQLQTLFVEHHEREAVFFINYGFWLPLRMVNV